MSDPRKHHYITKWQQRLWSHEKDQVNAVILRGTPNIKAITPNVDGLNAQRDLYSSKTRSGKIDVRLETELYSPLDDAACELTREIVSILDGGNTPKLNESRRSFFWKYFVCDAYKRHPDPIKRHHDDWDRTELKENIIKSLEDEGKSPSEAAGMFETIDNDENTKNIIFQTVRGSQPGERMMQFLKSDIVFYVAPEGTSFVLPDRTYEVGEERRSPLQGIWIPIHPKYAIAPVGPNAQAMVLPLDKGDVRRLNEHWYIMSKTVISTSKKLLVSLAKNVDRQKISFE